MGRKPRIQQPRAGTNGYDADVLKAIVGRIENVLNELLSERGSYMQRCKSLRDDIADIYEEGKARGIPSKPLKKALKERDLQRAIEALRADLDMVDQESFDQIKIKLGMLADLPLGEAALKGKAPPSSADETDVRPEFLKNKDAEAAAKNAEALEGGIKEYKPKSKLGGADAEGSYKLSS